MSLAHEKAQKRNQLDRLLDDRFDLRWFIRAGASTSVTGTNVGNFLASITNRYRTLRAQINAASTEAEVDAIDVTTGWPSNP